MKTKILIFATLFVLFLSLGMPTLAQQPIPTMPPQGVSIPVAPNAYQPTSSIVIFPTPLPPTAVLTWTPLPTYAPPQFWVVWGDWTVWLYSPCPGADQYGPYCQFAPLRGMIQPNGDYAGRILVQAAPRMGYYEIAGGNWYWGGEHWAKGLYVSNTQVIRL